jgi:hypothetical protein
MSDVKLDLELLVNNTLFLKIREQSDLITDLFNNLANEFQQEDLLKFHGDSKGTKISKGYNLANSPYQVLDLVRDFDGSSGFNIRVLNWWGHGLFIFVYYGSATADKYKQATLRLEATYLDCNHPSPWAYGQILTNQRRDRKPDTHIKVKKTGFLQFFKQIMPDPEFTKTYEVVKKEIRFVLDNHY